MLKEAMLYLFNEQLALMCMLAKGDMGLDTAMIEAEMIMIEVPWRKRSIFWWIYSTQL